MRLNGPGDHEVESPTRPMSFKLPLAVVIVDRKNAIAKATVETNGARRSRRAAVVSGSGPPIWTVLSGMSSSKGSFAVGVLMTESHYLFRSRRSIARVATPRSCEPSHGCRGAESSRQGIHCQARICSSARAASRRAPAPAPFPRPTAPFPVSIQARASLLLPVLRLTQYGTTVS
jgi:hypothetical protein